MLMCRPLKVGDKVRIKTLKELTCIYGEPNESAGYYNIPFTMNTDMLKHCGEIVTVDDCHVDRFSEYEFNDRECPDILREVIGEDIQNIYFKEVGWMWNRLMLTEFIEDTKLLCRGYKP